jgi:Tfp pilus assembly protein PilF
MWHPLTTLSHIVDCQLFGLNPIGHHLVSVLIHIINALLLLWILNSLTGTFWLSAFAAAVFALHPLQVESVAWAAERKTVLSGLFWFLTIAVYIWYTKRPSIGRYIMLFGTYSLCIMTKPVVVTLPFVLLLLDYWPLGRVEKISARRLIIEKIPLFVLSVILSVITYIAQKHGETVTTLQQWPFNMRIIVAMGSYFNYIVKMVYPKNLAVMYPIPWRITSELAASMVMGAVLLLVLWIWGRKKRWLVVGLLWYLGVLVPTLGLVQSGSQMMADRYMYLPSIGVLLIIAWAAMEFFSKMRYSKVILTSAAMAALVAMAIMTRTQITYWRDTPTLFKHAITVTRNNYTMQNNYGEYLCGQGRCEEGIGHFMKALSIWPEYPRAWMNLCPSLLVLNKFDDAINCYKMALRTRNDWSDIYKIYQGLGWAYEQKGELGQAEAYYREALKVKPDYAPARDGLASVLVKQGKMTGPGTTN